MKLPFFSRATALPRIEPVLNEAPVPVSGITPGTPAYTWLTGWDGAGGARPVNEQQAMSVSAVYACVALIGGAIASLPLKIYQRDGEGRKGVRPDTWALLNEEMSTAWAAPVGWEFSAQALLLNGNAFIEIVRASRLSPRVIGFRPWHPDRVTVEANAGRLIYTINDDGKLRAVDQDDMIHVPGPGFDGLRGMSQIAYALRQPARVSLDAGEQAATALGNGLRPDMAIIPPDHIKLDADQITLARKQWAERYAGSNRVPAPIMLSGGSKVEQLTVNAKDAQLLETRGFQVEDVARVFGVPPFMIGRTEKTTSWGSGIEQMGIGFVMYTLQRHLVKFETEINRKVFGGGTFCEFDTRGLERGDTKTRNDAYRIALGRAGEPAWMTVNEVRRAENLPPVDGGDTLNRGNENEPTAEPAAA